MNPVSASEQAPEAKEFNAEWKINRVNFTQKYLHREKCFLT